MTEESSSENEEPENQENENSNVVSISQLVFSNSRERSTQTQKKFATKSVKTQMLITSSSATFQEKCLFPSLTATTSSCSRIPAIENEDIANSAPSYSKDATDFVPSAAVEVDSESTMSATSSLDPGFMDSDAELSNLSLSTNSDESSEEVSSKEQVLIEGKPPEKQIKFIVFEDAIVDVFGHCCRCHAKCIVAIKNRIGSSCNISVSC